VLLKKSNFLDNSKISELLFQFLGSWKPLGSSIEKSVFIFCEKNVLSKKENKIKEYNFIFRIVINTNLNKILVYLLI
jgi:hypothetical protein